MLLSTKDLKYQMAGKHTEKFTEHFVGPYRVKAIISSNAIELELPSTIRIHSVVNVSRVQRYKLQVGEQKKRDATTSGNQRRRRMEGREDHEQEKSMGKG